MISKLHILMEKKGLNQKQVAEATGLSPGTIGKIYNNQFNRIDNHTVTALCQYFGLKSISELIEINFETQS